MKNSFIKKVAVLSAGAVLLSSVSFLGVNAVEEVKDTTLWSDECEIAFAPSTHGVDFGNFAANDVINGSHTLTGDKAVYPNLKTAVFSHLGSDAGNGGADTTEDHMIAVVDTCADTSWTMHITFDDLSGDNGFTIPSDTIKFESDGRVFYVGQSPATQNDEVEGIALTTWGVSMVFPSINNQWIWNNGDTTNEILKRNVPVSSPNLLYGEFAINADFEIEVPRYQPLGTYTGKITIDVQ